jgi:hypothetical protein
VFVPLLLPIIISKLEQLFSRGLESSILLCSAFLKEYVMDVSGSSREKNLMPGIDGMCLSKTKM